MEIYKNPGTRFVADFVGTSNFFSGPISDGELSDRETGERFVVSGAVGGPTAGRGGNASISIRPEKVVLLKSSGELPAGGERQNLKEGAVEVVTFLGVIVRILARMGTKLVIVDITEQYFEQNYFKMGDSIQLYFPPEDFLLFNE